MQPIPPDSLTVEQALAQCLQVASRRGAQIRAALRAQYGREEGDRRMSELACEAERTLWPAEPGTPEQTLNDELVAGVQTPNAEAPEHRPI
jgi:hypothetical protein